MKRQSNFELLRILLMLMIITSHVIMYSSVVKEINNIDYYITNFLRSFCMVATNAFVLIGGIFGISFKPEKIARISFRVDTYTWLSLVVAIMCGIHTIDLKKDVLLIFPILTKQYWFITDYFVLCMMAPFLNKWLVSLQKKELEIALLVGFIVFYALATVCFMVAANQIVRDAGYGIVNFVYLYCVGYYIRNFYVDKYKSTFYFLIFAVSSCLTFGINAAMSALLGFYFNSLISYNTVFMLVGAVSLVLAFKNLDIGISPIINKIAAKSFIVYIIHMNPVIGPYVAENILRIPELTGVQLVKAMFLLPVIVYVFCYIVDMIMDIVLNPAELYISKLATEVFAKLRKFFAY